jgi:hypothetical protein
MNASKSELAKGFPSYGINFIITMSLRIMTAGI